METHGNPCRSTRSTLQNLICYRMSVSRASGMPCGSVFGRFCVSRCRIGVTLRSIWGHLGVTLGSFLALGSHFVALGSHLGSLWIHFGALGVNFPTLVGHFVALGSHFGSLRNHFGALWGTWEPLWGTLAAV